MTELKIVRSSPKYTDSYAECFDAVAREGKFLTISHGYPPASMEEFIRGCHACGFPQYFLIDGQKRAVGWCDIVHRRETPDDVGYLGVGLLREYRGRGWGSRLMAATIRDAERRGFREIRLEVRVSNYNAIRTYRRLGFVRIAYQPDGVTTDGVSEDVWLMRLHARRIPRSHFRGDAFFRRFPRVRILKEDEPA